MKKLLSVLLAVIVVFTISALTAFAAETPADVTINGYTVDADENVKVIFVNINGEVTETAEDAVQVVIKAAGDLIVNGETFAAGANGKVNVLIDLPVTAPAPAEPAEETADNSISPDASTEEAEEIPVSDEEIIVGAADAPVAVGFWKSIWAFICSIFSFLF